jgi:hypothetical protein
VSRYWWFEEIERFTDFQRVAGALPEVSEMKISLITNGTSEIRVSMEGFPDALDAMNRCGGTP